MKESNYWFFCDLGLDTMEMWEEYLTCETLEQAVMYLANYRGEAKIIAGGTDLLIDLEAVSSPLPAVIDVTQIPDLQEIRVDKGSIHIGAAITFSQIISSPIIAKHSPHLIQAARTVGSRQIQNVATLVGNIIHASPAADSACPLYTLDATVHWVVDGLQESALPIAEFISGVNATVLPTQALVTGISFPIPEGQWFMSFRKLGLRFSMAISVVNCAIAVQIEDDLIRDSRIALGAVAPTPIRVRDAETKLIGMGLVDLETCSAPLIAAKASKPIDDFRSSASYRSEMVENLLRAELKKLAEWGMQGEEHAA